MKYIIVLLLFIAGCITVQNLPTPPTKPIVLDWEEDHPERAAWTTALIADLTTNFKSFDVATDANKFCPKYTQLSAVDKVHVWAEVIVWDSEAESSWNPTEASPDAGTVADKNTWSVGLMQVSVIDQANWKLLYGYTFSDLKDPIKNLHLAIGIMGASIVKHGHLLIPVGDTGTYWSTLHPGGKYDKSASIEAHTKALSFCN